MISKARRWRPGSSLALSGAGTPTARSFLKVSDLDADELIALLPSLEPDALAALAEYERSHAARPQVMQAIAGLQGWEART